MGFMRACPPPPPSLAILVDDDDVDEKAVFCSSPSILPPSLLD
jgi:hypothetical protein